VPAPREFVRLRTLPALTLANYSTLPPAAAAPFVRRLADVRRAEAQSALFTHCLAALPVPRTLEAFDVDLPGLVTHVRRLLLALEPLDHAALARAECPIDFRRSVIADTPPPARRVLREALRAVLAHAGASGADQFADEWIAAVRAMAQRHGYHSCCPENGRAILRKVSPDQALLQLRRPKPLVIVRHTFYESPAEISINGPAVDQPITFPVLNECDCAIEIIEQTGLVALLPADDRDALAGTFYEFVLALKYFALFIAEHPLARTAQYRRDVYITVAEAFIARSPFFTMFPGHVLQFLEQALPLCGTDLDGKLAQMMTLLAIYCGHVDDIRRFLDGLQEMHDEERMLG
jgi:hypothetical protein